MTRLDETLPASWYSSQKVFDLEMRAVFHKSWLFVGHTSRFTSPGDFLTYNIAGVDVVLIKNSDNEIAAYHNICGLDSTNGVEQTAEDKGGATFYWRYNGSQNLANTVHDTSSAINMFQDPKYKVNIHTTKKGLIYLNLNSYDSTLPAFSDWYDNLEETTEIFDFENYEYHNSYQLVGEFNWKTLVDGYQECYHCPTAHPGLSKAFSLPSYKVQPNNRWCRHYAKSKNESDSIAEFDGLWMFMFPCNGVNCYSPAWYSVRTMPIDVNKTVLQYDIYKKRGDGTKKLDEFVEFMQQLNVEDYHLCIDAQKNLNIGVYSTGPLNPNTENGVIFYQEHVKDMVVDHLKMEQAQRAEIWPADVSKIVSPNVSSQPDYFTEVVAF